ncbi:dihydroorotase [Sulfuracidifex metallicus]|uniref:Amidohydrolase family protein n=1 Tax=Sulfuracidifex metallicus DSM 6482 = JCM 9184 TaxID=523847 RepID=A0A6A9QN13_SULME|nr:amidohydrolase family protein [Sulfuracidifex metallicus]MUN29118.1 amidohydrolase family protein [Sulfuracidifex metallicus DSM 6482 = JCM 9184]WOE50361.1 amidohydrolase family protein [Sulfuracidifex metallicus DSM 6482 = JCM 9184]
MIISGVKTPTPDGITEVEVEIEGERIKKIGKSLLGEEKKNYHGMLLIPGGVDNHVHIYKRYLRVPTSDTVKDSTKAAIYGGTTTVIDFAFADHSPNVEERISHFQESLTNFSFHIFADNWSDNVEKYSKFFNSVKYMMVDYAKLKPSLSGLKKISEKLNGYVMVHAEDHELISTLSCGKRGSPSLHALVRPEETEWISVLRAKLLVRQGLVAHVSSGFTLELKGNMKAETTLHHLILSKEVYDRENAHRYVTSPPARDPEELWKRINMIDMIATDHNWFDSSIKDSNREFPNLVPGLPGVELRVPMIITEFMRRGLPLYKAVELLSVNPAKMNALDTGKIEEGYRADLVIYDTNMKWKITAENTHMADWTPYEGYEVIGKPRYVFRNGDLVLDDGEIKEGKGKLLRRTDID